MANLVDRAHAETVLARHLLTRLAWSSCATQRSKSENDSTTSAGWRGLHRDVDRMLLQVASVGAVISQDLHCEDRFGDWQASDAPIYG